MNKVHRHLKGYLHNRDNEIKRQLKREENQDPNLRAKMRESAQKKRERKKLINIELLSRMK